MDESSALTLIDALAAGAHPLTGERLAAEDLCQIPDVVRALCLASRALEERRVRSLRQRSLPANAGKPWTEEENDALAAGFGAGRSLTDLARSHRRTSAGIQSRLEKLGLAIPAGRTG